jgi:ParB-like chromosome segregation protein Spo0J
MAKQKFQTELIPASQIKLNPNNPRLIKDDKYKKLVQSIKDFPEMLHIRPIVVNDEMIVLGGNMRLRACIEAGLKEIPTIKASSFTEEQQKEFLIKDNVGFGEWDWDVIANEWDAESLDKWGITIPSFAFGGEVTDDDLKGLPSYDEEADILKLIVSFRNEEDRALFVAQNELTTSNKKGTMSCWWPHKGNDDTSSVRFESK